MSETTGSMTPSGRYGALPWEPTYTRREAGRRFGIRTASYRELTAIARAVVEHHRGLGTPRHQWEPAPQHVEQLVGSIVSNAELALIDRLRQDVDPRCDESQHSFEHAKALLEAAEQHPAPVITPESGSRLSGAETATAIQRHDEKIEGDFAAGKTHHRRTSRALKVVSRLAPWVEAVGFLAFITYYLNVPLLRPLDDPLGWTFAVSVVVAAIVGQTWLVHHAATAHNQAREAAADNHRHEAERSYRRRNRLAAFALVVAAAITAGMIQRGTVALGDTTVSTTAVMIFLAVMTGAVLPTLAYLAIAFDGSKAARERDSIASDLAMDAQVQAEMKGQAAAVLEQHVEIAGLIRHSLLPDILTQLQALLNGAASPYNFLRVQIGGLTSEPPKHEGRIPMQRGQALPTSLTTGLPGARSLDLAPLAERMYRLETLDAEHAELKQRLADIPEHPWSRLARQGS